MRSGEKIRRSLRRPSLKARTETITVAAIKTSVSKGVSGGKKCDFHPCMLKKLCCSSEVTVNALYRSIGLPVVHASTLQKTTGALPPCAHKLDWSPRANMGCAPHIEAGE